MTLPENKRRPSRRRWTCGAICGGLVGLGHSLNIILVYRWYLSENVPFLVGACPALIGIGAVAGLVSTPLFSSKDPLAVAFQSPFLGAAIGSFALPFIGMVFEQDGSSGPANPFLDGFAVIGLIAMTVCGAVAGSVVGLIGWPVLKRILRK